MLFRSACRNQKERLKKIAPNARDFTDQRAYRNRPLSDADALTSRRQLSVRATVWRGFGPLTTLWGYAKARYRGLIRNASRTFVVFALLNINRWGRPPTGQVRPACPQVGYPPRFGFKKRLHADEIFTGFRTSIHLPLSVALCDRLISIFFKKMQPISAYIVLAPDPLKD
mgnify:CR=1 FL=1